MVIQLDVESSDTVVTAATAAVQMAGLLKVNVKFYYNRVGYYVHPGESVTSVINSVNVGVKKAKK